MIITQSEIQFGLMWVKCFCLSWKRNKVPYICQIIFNFAFQSLDMYINACESKRKENNAN